MGARLNKDGKPTSAYFCRPKYLLAPDPSTLAQPGLFVAQKHHRHMHLSDNLRVNHCPSGAFSGRRGVGSFNIASFARVRGTWTFVAAGASATLPISSGECEVSFPPPPTLADIQRMEPELSLTAALMRAVDHPQLSMPDLPDAAGISVTDMQTGCSVPEPSTAVTYEPPRQFRIVVENSPIVREQKISQASGMQRTSALPPSLSPRHEEGTLCEPIITEQSVQRTGKGMVDSPSSSIPENPGSPSCTILAPEFTEQDKRNFKTLAGWLADYLYVVLCQDKPCDSRLPSCGTDFSWYTRHYTADQIYSILRCTLPSVSAVFLALWYIGRLPVGFVNSEVVSRQYIGQNSLPIDEVIIRTFVTGSILANKWLEDCNFSSRSWHRVLSLPLGLINRLEASALVALDYDLGISSNEWNQWLIDIRMYHSSLARFQPISRNLGAPYILIRQLMDEALSAFRICQDACSRREQVPVRARECIQNRISPLSPNCRSDGCTSASGPPLCDDGSSSIDLPLPACWHPEADPIVFKASRTMGSAPGIHRVQKPCTTMSMYAADRKYTSQALACVVDALTWRSGK